MKRTRKRGRPPARVFAGGRTVEAGKAALELKRRGQSWRQIGDLLYGEELIGVANEWQRRIMVQGFADRARHAAKRAARRKATAV